METIKMDLDHTVDHNNMEYQVVDTNTIHTDTHMDKHNMSITIPIQGHIVTQIDHQNLR